MLLEKEKPLPSSGTKPSAEIFNVGMGARRRRRGDYYWHGQGRRGLLAWIWSQGKKFAMLTCDEQEVSAQLGCLYLSLYHLSSTRVGWGGRDNPGQDQAREKRNGGKPQRPTSSLPQRERRQLPSFERLETRRLLVQSLLFISQRHNHTEYFFDYLFSPLPHDQHVSSPPPQSPLPPPGGRLAWYGSQPLGGPRDKVSRARWRGFVRPGSVGITYITLTRSGFEYCSGSWVIRVLFVGKMGSRDGGE